MAQNIAGSGWFSTPNRIFESGLSTFEIVVLTYLHRRSGPDGSSWPSISRIALDCRMSDRSVQRTLQRLKEGGWIRLVERKGDSGAWSTYLFELNGVTDSRGGDTQSPGVVSESHQGGDTQSPEGLSREGLPSKKEPLTCSPNVSSTLKSRRPKSKAECEAYFLSKNSTLEIAAAFWLNKEAIDWCQGRGGVPLKDWRSAADLWMLNEKKWARENGHAGEEPRQYRRATEEDKERARR